MNNPRFCYIKESPRVAKAVGEKNSYWKTGETISYYFVQGSVDQRNFVRSRIQNLMTFMNLKFVETDSIPDSDLRIAFAVGQGSWSYIGKYNRNVAKNLPTMNFGWLNTVNPTDTGLVDHELGHAIGAGHEHKFPGWIIWNEARVISDMAKQGWSESTTRWNILNQYNPGQVNTTPSADRDSVMLYLFPKEWTLNNVETKLNFTWSLTDKRFWAATYPYPIVPVEPIEPEEEDDDFTEPTEPEICLDPKYLNYENALKAIYDNKRFTNAGIRLPLVVNKEVAIHLGLSSLGLERDVVNRIKLHLNNKAEL